MWFGFWTVAFLAVLAITVVLTLLVENWGRWRQPVGSAATPANAVALRSHAVDVDAGLESSSPLEVLVDGRTAADRLVAALFASYASQRLPEANRVAAWVTAGERLPSDDGSLCEPGASLRGRPAAVQRLLECDEEGRTWVALNEHVDIALGVSRRPPTCAVLVPLVELWHATREQRVELSGDAVTRLADAIDTLAPTWSPTTAAAVIGPLAAVLAEAAAGSRVHPVSLTVEAPSDSDRAGPSASADDDESDPTDTRAEAVAVYA